ncbi:hypothetical protein [Deinococcus yavapaiensis]|uniref:Uncharacterized protein n=1 Tax=Deinococcus yavapaiensis KR-236 TaxID=694435 RepID=A0A318S8Q0_9DEIO|nr:hypothetical protein [Deinococcus yavapaiensis]PYE55417.1 hypothetical protein DES52_103250 [Deinococcus yavapaiensis KR-236]
MHATLPLALLLTTALAAPSASPRVTFDARHLGVKAVVRDVPAERTVDDPLVFPAPRHVEATFGPRDGGDTRELDVYGVADLLALRANVARSEIEALRALLKPRAALPSKPGALPFLPRVPAAQLLNGAAKIVTFTGGSGVRYLTAFSQELAPVTRAQVFYTFQGLTADGKYYVSLQWPVSLTELPTGYDAPDTKKVLAELASADETRANAAWTAYVTRTKRELDRLTNDARLTKLDAFVKSIRVR